MAASISEMHGLAMRERKSVTVPAAGRILIPGLVLGFGGFVTGYFAPVALNPSANLGPVLGIFLTGPGGLLVGLAFAAIAELMPLRGFRYLASLTLLLLSVTGLTLYLSLPPDRFEGTIVAGQVVDCKPPVTLTPEAVKRWKAVREGEFYVLRQGWERDVPRMLQSDPGVVLAVRENHRWDLFKGGKPWNRGRLSAKQSSGKGVVQQYFARPRVASCASFTTGERVFFFADWEASPVSPPDILPTFLGLYVIKQVPREYEPFCK